MIPKSDMYKDTDVSTAVSRDDIHRILSKFNILERRWTEMGPENTFLEFLIKQEGRPNIKIKINVPYIESQRRPAGRGPLITEYDEKRAYRFLFHYIKALLSAKDVDFATVEEIFMAHIVIPLPNGQETTMGEQLTKTINSGNMPQLDGFTVTVALPKLERVN